MHVDTCHYTQNGKPRSRTLLRTSYREGGKVKHKTIANLSHCPPEEIEAIRLALRHKHQLRALSQHLDSPVTTQQGLAVGAVYALHAVAKRLGLVQALGRKRESGLALWLILARLIDPGSRLSAVRLATQHAACDVLGLDAFNEDDLYATLDWLDQQQETIENRLYAFAKKGRAPQLFLYDVTSSYFEGQQNELADYGYPRDGKKGKKQIVIGLLTDADGDPVSVQVYRGNTADPTTFGDQVRKIQDRFGVESVTLVGDRGMIKTRQIQNLPDSFHYVTAITKPQIRTLLEQGTLQMELFDETVCEVDSDQGRYVLRRNPVRVDELAAQRKEKQKTMQKRVDDQNAYLRAHPRARESTALRRVRQKIRQLKLDKWMTAEAADRRITLQVNENALQEHTGLDGCYVLKTDVSSEAVSAQVIHDRYKDLAEVELAFRTMKTGLLETRPHFVRKESRTRGHVFGVMLAYKLVRHLKEAWKAFDMTVAEGIHELSSIDATKVIIGSAQYQTVPKPRVMGQQLLEAIGVVLPEALPSRGVTVATRKPLTPRT